MWDVYLYSFLVGIVSSLPLIITATSKLIVHRREVAEERDATRAELEERLAALESGRAGAHTFFSRKGWRFILDVPPVALEGDYGSWCSASGRFGLPAGPKFAIAPESFFDSVAKEYGTKDLVLGNSAFDKQFMVRSSSTEATRLLWSEQAQKSMVELFSDAAITCDGEVVRLERRGDPRVLVERATEMIELIEALLSADLFGGDALRTLAGLSPEAGRPLEVQLVICGATVSVGARLKGDHAVTCIWADRAARSSARDAWDQLSPASRELMEALGPDALERGERRTALWFYSIETDVQRLRAAAELIALETAVEGGPYR